MKQLCIACLALWLMAAMGGCTDKGIDADPANPASISFASFSVGQKSRYLHWIGTTEYYKDEQGKWRTRNDSIHYVRDTLVVEIRSVTANGFDAVEYYTPGSPILLDLKGTPWEAASYPFSAAIVGDNIIFSGHSELVEHFSTGYRGRRPFPLKEMASPEIKFSAWRPSIDPVEGYAQGCLREHWQFGKRYLWLNVIIDNTEIKYDGEGRMVIYSRKHGIVRVIVRLSWGQGIAGYDLML